jgi:predicted SprT family Zn-dependent metalloprotease
MDLKQAQELAEELIAEHLGDQRFLWTFRWIGHVTVMGLCIYRTHEIGLSKPLTAIADDDAVRDTILHEIAHALAGPTHDHDATWRGYARRLGAPTDAKIHESRVGNPRQTLAPWVGTCPAGHESANRFFRKPRARYSCSQCSTKWSEEHLITYRKMF